MNERHILRQVLIRLLDVIKFLSKQNLSLDSNYLKVPIKVTNLLSSNDLILEKYYLEEVNDNRQYLLPKIQNEFIDILVNNVK